MMRPMDIATAHIAAGQPAASESSWPQFARRAGSGLIEVVRVGRKSVAVRVAANSPLRLLTPGRCPGDAAWIYSSTFGGGVVAGDRINLKVDVGDDGVCLLATQASTKVFRSSGGVVARQTLSANVREGGVCVILPDPLTCYADARFEQSIDVHLAQTASLVLVDWLSSGRQAYGERWAFERYRSTMGVNVADRPRFRDAVLLDSADGPVGGEFRMGRCDCIGTVVLMGPKVSAAAGRILADVSDRPARGEQSLVFAASPLEGGAVLRVAGPDTQSVGQWLRQQLRFITELIGGDPWARKW